MLKVVNCITVCHKVTKIVTFDMTIFVTTTGAARAARAARASLTLLYARARD